MADFSAYYPILSANEGGYANHALDPGRETYHGISRKSNRAWPGWATVDALKNKLNLTDPVPNIYWRKLNVELAADASLAFEIQRFYRVNYWDSLRLSEVNSQSIANQLADHGVNAGIVRPAMMLQYLLATQFGFPIKVDGVVGAHTIAALNNVNPTLFYLSFVDMRQAFYNCRAGLQPSTREAIDWHNFFCSTLGLKPDVAMQAYLHPWLERTNVAFIA